MLLLELFAGTKSVGAVAKNFGFDVISLDINPEFECDLTMDILDFSPGDYKFIPDVIWASPDCTSFSIAASGFHRRPPFYYPRTEKAFDGDKMMFKLIKIIDFYLSINPKLIYFIENPRGMLQKMFYMKRFESYKRLISYCQYGDTRMKPTNIWTNCSSWFSKPICKRGDNCHQSSPRCTFTGGTVALKNSKLRSVIPRGLIEDIFSSLPPPQ